MSHWKSPPPLTSVYLLDDKAIFQDRNEPHISPHLSSKVLSIFYTLISDNYYPKETYKSMIKMLLKPESIGESGPTIHSRGTAKNLGQARPPHHSGGNGSVPLLPPLCSLSCWSYLQFQACIVNRGHKGFWLILISTVGQDTLIRDWDRTQTWYLFSCQVSVPRIHMRDPNLGLATVPLLTISLWHKYI